MTKEVRVLFLCILTLLVYATNVFLTHGAFIFPFPLNDILMLIVAIQFSYWHFKQRIPVLYILGIAFFSLLGNEVYWSFFLEDQKMYTFSESPITDVFKLFSAVCLVGFGYYTLRAQKNQIAQLLSLIFIICYIGSITFLPPVVGLFALLSIGISVLLHPVHKPFHLFWILLLLLESTKYLTIVINN